MKGATDEERAQRAAERRIALMVPEAIDGCAALLLPLTGEERKRVLKALKKRGLIR